MNIIEKFNFLKNSKKKDFGSISGKATFSSFDTEKQFKGNVMVSHPSQDELDGKTLIDWPSYIALEVTNVCNLECTHCNYRFGVPHYTRDRGFTPEDIVDKVLSEAAENKTQVMMNYDGEPLMHKNYLQYLRKAEEKNVHTYFNTNGMMFSEKLTDELVSFYRGGIQWSIDGDKDWFEKVRVGGNYELVTKNLDYFLKANEKAGFPIDVGISFCNLGQSIKDRKKFVNKWIDKVSFVSLGEVNNKDGSIISEPMVKFKVKQRPVCNVPWQTVGICHNGDVVPCSIYITRANTVNAILGNVKDKTIKEIWNDKPIRDFRKMLAERKIENTYCQTCERWKGQFYWDHEHTKDQRIEYNGFWTTVYNKNFSQPTMKDTSRILNGE